MFLLTEYNLYNTKNSIVTVVTLHYNTETWKSLFEREVACERIKELVAWCVFRGTPV